MPLSSDEMLDEYRIVRRLGSGGFGTVYLAQDTLLDRPVAIKELHASLAGDENVFQRFLQEARTAGALDSKHVVTVYGLKQTGDDYYLISEYVPGGSVRDYLQREGKLTVENAVRIAGEVCDALSAVHEKGVIHRDIKPENVLLGANGEAKVTDFGVAHVPELMGGFGLTQTDFQPGTMLYMSPEQIQGEPVGKDTDAHAVGILLYEMLTGQHPIDVQEIRKRARESAGTNMMLLQARFYEFMAEAITARTWRDVQALRPDVPDWVAATIESSLNATSLFGLRRRLAGGASVYDALLDEFDVLTEFKNSWASAKANILPHISNLPEKAFVVNRVGMRWEADPQLSVGLVLDGEQLMQNVVENDLEEWGVSVDEAYETAYENLANHPGNDSLTPITADNGYIWAFCYETGDGYDATRILLPSIRSKICALLETPVCIVRISNRDLMIAFRFDVGEKIRNHFEEEGKRDVLSHHHPMTAQLYMIDSEGNLEPLPPDHAVDNSMWWINRGMEHFKNKQLRQAICDYTCAVKLAPEAPEFVLALRGEAYFQAREYEKAIPDLTAALDAGWQPEAILPTRGYAYEVTGELDAAVIDYTRAIELDSQNVECFFRRGVVRFLQGEDDDASADYTRAIELDPRNAKYFCRRGGVRVVQGDPDGAIADCTRAIEIFPEYASAFAVRGEGHAYNGEHDEAIADYNRAIEINPQEVTSYSGRGMSWAAKGEYDKAIGDFTRAIEIDPHNGFYLYYRGQAQAYKGEHDEAIADLTRAIELEPQNAEAVFLRGDLRHLQGEHDEAIADLTRAIELEPQNARAVILRGEVRQNKGEPDEAIADFTRAIEIDPESSLAFCLLGVARRNKGEYDEAIADFTRAIEIDPHNGFYLYYRGQAQAYKGEHDEAIADLTRAIEIDPQYGAALFGRAMAFWAKGDYARALSELREAVEIDSREIEKDPHNVKAYNSRAWNLLLIGEDVAAALQDVQTGLAIQPSPYLYGTRGTAHAMSGQYDKALSDFDEVLKQRESPLNYFHRAVVRQRLGDPAGAEADFRKARGLHADIDNDLEAQMLSGPSLSKLATQDDVS